MNYKKDFPFYEQPTPWVYLDSAATCLKPKIVIDRVTHYYRDLSSNVHRALHPLSEKATEYYEGTRDGVQKFINAEKRYECIFTKGTTESINLVARCLGELILKPEDEILLTFMEHHSNIVPWQLVAQKTGAKIVVAPLDDLGNLDLEKFKNLLGPKTKIAAFAYISNVLGVMNPVKEMIALCHEKNIVTVVDAAQAVARQAIDVQDLNCDFLAFSAHKLYGPTGVGILYGKEKYLNMMPPLYGGGDMINVVTFSATTFNDLPYKFEAGTPNIAGVIGLGAAIEFVQQIGMPKIAEHDDLLTCRLQQELASLNFINILAPQTKKFGLVSFTMHHVHPQDMATLLGKWSIALRTGHLCAQPLIKSYGLTSVARASIGLYTNDEDINNLIIALKKTKEFLA